MLQRQSSSLSFFLVTANGGVLFSFLLALFHMALSWGCQFNQAFRGFSLTKMLSLVARASCPAS